MSDMKIDIASMTEQDAARLPAQGKKDKSVVVFCGNRFTKWNSRELATEFYCAGMNSCEGSEADRYAGVYTGLIFGEEFPNDIGLDSIEMARRYDAAEKKDV